MKNIIRWTGIVSVSVLGLGGCSGAADIPSETVGQAAKASQPSPPPPPPPPALLNWQNTDDFTAVGGEAAGAGIAVDPSNNVYASGFTYGTANPDHSIVRKSGAGGASFQLVDDYGHPIPADGDTLGTAVVADGAGNVYAAAYTYGGTPASPRWIVRYSTDGGATWSIADNFTLNGTRAVPRAIAMDSSGNVFVAGLVNDPAQGVNSAEWIVRKGSGTSWSTVDTISLTSNGDATSVLVHPTLGVFVGGYIGGATGKWTVRRSQNGGSTWTTVDSFTIDTKASAEVEALAMSGGTIFASGRAASGKPTSYNHWVTRKSTNGGTTWTTIDDYSPNTSHTVATGVAVDTAGNVFVCGYNSGHWLVRRSVASAAFTLVDDFRYATTGSALAWGVAADALGNVFVTGRGTDLSGIDHFLVRKLVP